MSGASDQAMPGVVRTERVFDSGFIGLRIDHLAWPDGTTYPRAVVEYGQSVAIVAVDDDGRLLLVRQYRHPAGTWLLEIPAGGIDDKDASPEEAAIRELREETGYRGTIARLGGFYLACGYSDEYQHIFLATGLVEDPLPGDDDEDVRLERLALDEVLQLLDADAIGDSKTVGALLMYQRYLERSLR